MTSTTITLEILLVISRIPLQVLHCLYLSIYLFLGQGSETVLMTSTDLKIELVWRTELKLKPSEMKEGYLVSY